MHTSRDAVITSVSSRASRWLGGTIALASLAGVAGLDYLTGRNTSFTLLYLAPITVAVWFVGRRAGIAIAVAAAIAGLAIAMLDRSMIATSFWNAGVKFGVYLTFCTLLNYLKTHHAGLSVIRTIGRMLAMTAACAVALALLGSILQRQFPVQAAPTNPGASITGASKPGGALAAMAGKLDEALRLSRPLLLGSRDPMGPSCVSVIKTGEVRDAVPTNPGDWNGGPGTTMATLYYFDRQNNKSPMQDFNWHQNRLKTFLSNEAASNLAAAQAARDLAECAEQFAEATHSWSSVPVTLLPIGYTRNSEWPSYCMAALDRAVKARDLEQTRRWAAELAEAAFSLDDLHRWLGFLVENHLNALEFQNRCQTLFAAAEARKDPYDPQTTISQFPAGVLSLNGLSNYYEVERQAERLFSMPSDEPGELSSDQYSAPGAMWLVPGVRESYLKLEAVLSPDNQKTWELAAHTPYFHSYLINMLYRAARAGTEDDLCTVLKKLDSINPRATVGELTSVLMYRGHSFAGLEWADRFRPQLLSAAEEISTSETDSDALMAACRWTNRFYTAPASPATYGVTFTLRDALEQKRLDCVRATDMIGAIFRNAGRTRFAHLRWCAETAGHSVAAYVGTEHDKPHVVLADGLNPPDQPEAFPDCFFHGHAWPPGMTSNPTPYAVELYIRGLDSYIWADGYIIRGPHAGELTSVAIPYSTHHKESSTRKVFDGPYPE